MEMPESITKGLEALDHTLCSIADEVLNTTDTSAAASITLAMLMPMIEFRRQHVEALDFLSYSPSVEEVAPEEPLDASVQGEPAKWMNMLFSAWHDAWPFMKIVDKMVGPVTAHEMALQAQYAPSYRHIISYMRERASQLESRLYTKDDSLDVEPMSMGKPGSGGVAEMEKAIHQVYLDEVKVPIPWSDEG